MPLMSMREYARHRGCYLNSVQAAVKSGRITLTQGKIDSDAADRAWVRNTNPSLVTRGAGATGSRQAIAQAMSPDRNPDSGSGPDYSKARAVKEHYAARIAKLEFEERSGKLIDKAEAKSKTFEMFRKFRDRMTAIPDRCSALLAAEADQFEVHRILTEEIDTALRDFADGDG